MLTLLIDNYDSFTYNLFQLLAEENGREPVVVRNDEASWEELARLGCDNVVLSPGPGRPERARDFGVCAEAIRRCEVPLLGVCLGHQGLGWVHGGRVVPAPEPMHGRVRAVEHAGAPLFAGIPARFEATRYHSLCLERPLPGELEEIAWADDGVPMAVAHRTRPQWGVQFHPESIATEHGRRLLANFRDLTAAAGTSKGSRRDGLGELYGYRTDNSPRGSKVGGDLELKTRRLEYLVDLEGAFAALYGQSEDAFWLDSARPGNGARFSFMGDASGPLAATVSYDVDAHEVTVERGGGPKSWPRRSSTTWSASWRGCLGLSPTSRRQACPSSSTAASPAISATRSRPTAPAPTSTPHRFPTPPSSSPTASSPSTTSAATHTSSACTRPARRREPKPGSPQPPPACRPWGPALRWGWRGKTRRSLPAAALPSLPPPARTRAPTPPP